MNRPAIILALLWPLLANAEPATPSPSSAPAAAAPSGRPTYDSFRLIHTRNVFDPDRRPVRPVGNTTATAPTQADYAALTGTMLSAQKSYAFFSGSRPEFNKVLSVQDKFANATIAAITGQSIEIERSGKHTTILIGQTVPFDNQTAPGEPPIDAPPPDTSTGVSAPAAPGTPASGYRPVTGAASPNRPTAAGSSAAASKPPANIDEIRRRMMEKRQQELK